MKNVMKAAHQLTKEIKAEFPNVDYKAQLGICIAYLSSNKEEGNTMVELQGSEKQIKWATDIRENISNMLDKKIDLIKNGEMNMSIKNELIRNRQYFRNKAKNLAEARVECVSILGEIKEAILTRQDARWFITYRHMDVETLVCNYCGEMKETVFFKES